MGSKSVCLACRKAFNHKASLIEHPQAKCPECGLGMHFLHPLFKPPKRTDLKRWQVVSYLVAHGFNYAHLYEMSEPGVYKQLGRYPETMKEAEELVRTFHSNGIKKQ